VIGEEGNLEDAAFNKRFRSRQYGNRRLLALRSRAFRSTNHQSPITGYWSQITDARSASRPHPIEWSP